MATDSSDRTREEGDSRNRWRQMIAQEGNEIRAGGGKVKCPCGGKLMGEWIDWRWGLSFALTFRFLLNVASSMNVIKMHF